MKMTHTTSPLITSDDMQSSVMGMDFSGMEMACYFLRDKIYSNKIKACIREATTNATDEHIKFSIDRPVQIGIRKENDGDVFFVRDYAKGLNEYSVRNVFGKYFKTTKSNDNTQVGGFGIGSCASHAYTDTFYVVSHFEGQKTIYACVLGGGDSGVPVGHIYKTHEEPSAESGLEILVPIKQSDKYEFVREMKSFIRYFNFPIEGSSDGITCAPETPVFERKWGDFNVRVLPFGTGNIYYAMGGVIYHTRHDAHNIEGASLNYSKDIVVDFPIGSMSLPISREAFETTTANERKLGELKNLFIEHIKNEIKSFESITLEDLIAKKDESLEGEIFSYKKQRIFGSLYAFAFKVNVPANPEMKDGKKILITIPDKKTFEYWAEKLTDFEAEKDVSYCSVIDSAVPTGENYSKALALFHIKNIKSLPFPKGEGITKFWVHSDRRKVGQFTPLEYFNHVSQQEFATVEEAEKYIAEFFQNKNLSESMVHRFTISDYQMYKTNSTKSTKMSKALVKMGFLNIRSEEFRNKIEEIQKREAKIKQEREKFENAVPVYIGKCGEKIKQKIKNRAKFAEKIKGIFNAVEGEKSFRSKILKILSKQNYYDRVEISRDELRKILLLK